MPARLLIYLTFLFFSFGQLARVSFFGQQVNLYLYEITLFLTLIYFLFKYGPSPLKIFLNDLRSVFAFLFFLFLSFLIGAGGFSVRENWIAFLYLGRLCLYFTYLAYLMFYLKKEKSAGKTISRSILIFIVVTVVFTAIQYLFYPDLINLFYLGWDPHYYRAFGVYFDTGVSGAVFGLSWFYVYKRCRRPWFLLVVLLAAIYLTYSRSLYLAFILTLGIVTVSQKRYWAIFLLIGFFLVLYFFVPKRTGEGVNLLRTFSIESRIADNKTALSLWGKKPIFGWGYNRIRYVKKKFNLINPQDYGMTHAGASFHSSYGIILVSSGLVGLLLFLAAMFAVGRISGLASSLVFFAGVMSLTDNIILHPFILFLMFTFSVSPLSDR